MTMTRTNKVGTQTPEQAAIAQEKLPSDVAGADTPSDDLSDNDQLDFVVVPAYN
jgi:hypothetical protein